MAETRKLAAVAGYSKLAGADEAPLLLAVPSCHFAFLEPAHDVFVDPLWDLLEVE
jgi:hypothetical protein